MEVTPALVLTLKGTAAGNFRGYLDLKCLSERETTSYLSRTRRNFEWLVRFSLPLTNSLSSASSLGKPAQSF